MAPASSTATITEFSFTTGAGSTALTASLLTPQCKHHDPALLVALSGDRFQPLHGDFAGAATFSAAGHFVVSLVREFGPAGWY